MYSGVGMGGLGLCVGGYDVVDGSACGVQLDGSTMVNSGAAGGGGNNWGSFFQGLIKQGVNIVDKIYTPPTYSVGADGSVAYRGGQAGGGAAVGSAAPGGGAFASIPSSWIWIGGGGLVLMLVLASKGGGRR